jgi:hypothetical protein
LRFCLAAAVIASDRLKPWGLLVSCGMLFGVPLIVAISGSFKALLLSGEIYVLKDWVLEFFGGEFLSSGRNLYELNRHGFSEDWGFFYNDLLRGLLPPGFGSRLMSATGWFHSIYRVDEGFAGSSGWGLGFVAEGLLCSRTIGPFVLLGFVGGVVSVIYRARLNNKYNHVFYALAATSAVYCIRADIANFISMVFKLGLVAVYGPVLLAKVTRQR